MRNKDKWAPKKFVFEDGKLVASREHVGKGSLLIADLTAEKYQIYIPKYASGKLLDLGCGFVPFRVVYQDYVEDNICVDWDNSVHKNDFLDLSTDINNPLPFEDSTFNTILVSDVLEHIYSPFFIFNEMKRLLAKDGVIILNTPFAYWEHEAPYDYFRYTKYFYEKIAGELDFKVEVLEPIGDGFDCVSDFLSKMAGGNKRLLTFAKIADKFARKKDRQKFLTNLPLGYFVVLRKK